VGEFAEIAGWLNVQEPTKDFEKVKDDAGDPGSSPG
jgi:hypothetical protein